MFKNTAMKKTFIFVVVLVMLVAVLLTACDGNKKFTPVEMPEKGEVEGNGGVAVKYGDWIYYVNGYQSSVSAENTYVNVEARAGAIARIKVADLEALFAVHEETITSSEKTKKIASLVKEKAQIVVPNFYHSGNTAEVGLNGIFIFDDRLYITTPNTELTAGGNAQTNQLVLTSYKLDGSDPQQHFTFTNNAAKIMLSKVEEKLYATYVMDGAVHSLDVLAKTDKEIVKSITGDKFDIYGNAVFYLDENGSICKFAAGASENEVIVENVKLEGHDKAHITYTIKSVNDGYVYYTKKDSTDSSLDDINLFYATNAENKDKIVLATTAPSASFGWKDKLVYTVKDPEHTSPSLYGIFVTTDDINNPKVILDPIQNSTEITFNRIEGDILYYTASSVAYYVNLASETIAPVAYAKSLASASNWYQPDVLGEYVFTVSAGTITVVKFDKAKEINSSSVTLTIVAEEKED